MAASSWCLHALFLLVAPLQLDAAQSLNGPPQMEQHLQHLHELHEEALDDLDELAERAPQPAQTTRTTTATTAIASTSREPRASLSPTTPLPNSSSPITFMPPGTLAGSTGTSTTARFSGRSPTTPVSTTTTTRRPTRALSPFSRGFTWRPTTPLTSSTTTTTWSLHATIFSLPSTTRRPNFSSHITLLPPRTPAGTTGITTTTTARLSGRSSNTPATTTTTTRYYKQILWNHHDVQYWGYLDIGNQTVQGLMDTGSYELLVASKQCEACGDAAVYTHSETTRDLHHTAINTYGSGKTFAKMVTDRVSVHLAPITQGLHTRDQYFWEIIKADCFESAKFQAIVGLGPPEVPDDDAQAAAERIGSLGGNNGDDDTANNSRSVAKAEELAAQPTMLESFHITAFSVCLQRPSGAPGYLIWNDEKTRSSQPDLFTTLRLSGTRTWGVKLTQASLGRTRLGCGSGCGAILDTGTSLLMTDPSTFRALYGFLLDQMADRKLEKDCSNLDEMPDLVFNLDGKPFSLPPQSYLGIIDGPAPMGAGSLFPNHTRDVQRGPDIHLCNLLVSEIRAETEVGPLWVLGMPFFREYYTTFDLGENPRDPASRSIHTARAGEDCAPASAEEAEASAEIQYQRTEVRTLDPSQVIFPSWATTASRTGNFQL